MAHRKSAEWIRFKEFSPKSFNQPVLAMNPQRGSERNIWNDDPQVPGPSRRQIRGEETHPLDRYVVGQFSADMDFNGSVNVAP